MSSRLRQFLAEAYFSEKEFLTCKVRKGIFIQIDDQDDNDDLTEFCNIFVTVICETFPDRPEATLSDTFIKLLSKHDQ